MEYRRQEIDNDDEDVWYNEDKLYRDHIQEVLDKWTQIDEEIWSKIIIFERNRRVGKAYIRSPVVTVNGCDEDFDGYRIGLCGFDNPLRDRQTEELRRHVGFGIKIKMDDSANILVKRLSKCNVYIKNTNKIIIHNTIGNEILKLPNYCLELEKPVKLFDMKKFQSNLSRELRRAYPDRKRLERQCVSVIAFVKSEETVLACPIWILVLNVVAIGVLKNKIGLKSKFKPPIPIPFDDDYNVDDYQEFCQECYGFEKLSLLPSHKYEMSGRLTPSPDYYISDDDECCRNKKKSKNKGKGKNHCTTEDPYYCGFSAHKPKFVQETKKDPTSPSYQNQSASSNSGPSSGNIYSSSEYCDPLGQLDEKFCEECNSTDPEKAIYSQIYGDIPIPTRGFIPRQPIAFIGDWNN